MRTLLSAALAFLATTASAQNFPEAWPPEPYLSAAIASIRAEASPWVSVPQSEINRLCGIHGALGCTRDGPLGLFIMVADHLSPRWHCLVLIHEEAHRLGWPGGHPGGSYAPSRCPL